MDQRTCVACGDQFTPGRATQKTCSNRCYMWNQRHPGEPRPAERTCPTCGAQITSTHAGALYCSAPCRAAASKRRNCPVQAPYVRHATCQRCGGPMPPGTRAGTKLCSTACGRRNKAAERAAMQAIGTRRCAHCGAEFEPKSRRNVTCSPRCSGLAHYYANRDLYTQRALTWMAEHPERHRQNTLAWQAANAEAISARNLAWTRAHPDRVAVIGQRRRALKLSNPDSVGVSAEDWTKALNRAQGRCYYCGTRPDRTLQMEHVIPLSRGGRHAIGNIVPACAPCNQSKHDKLIIEWRMAVSIQWSRSPQPE